MSIASLILTDTFKEIYGDTAHLVTEHILVGNFYGWRRGVTDWMMNQAALNLFYGLFFICTFYTTLFTFWFDDEGVAFYQCY